MNVSSQGVSGVLAILVALLCLSAGGLRGEFSLLSGASIPGVVHDVAFYYIATGSDLILVAREVQGSAEPVHVVQVLNLDSAGGLTQGSTVVLHPIFGAADTLRVGSVAADPLGRGFGVATVIPSANTGLRGKLVFFDLGNGSILRVVEVGFDPKSVTFTPDGRRVIVANEGEFAAGRPHAPGSISVVNLTAHPTAASLRASPPPVATIDFRTGLAFGVTLDGLRINVPEAPAAERYLHIEPESVTATNEKAYSTLQECNAIATVDLTGANANRISAILPLGTIRQRIDASDRDYNRPPGANSGIVISQVVSGLPMPGSIATFVLGGRRFVATANEGEPRSDDGDIARAFSRRSSDNTPIVDTSPDSPDDVVFGGSLGDADLGRLFISLVDGNLDADPLIEEPTMLGTRSFSLWDEAGNRAFDSGFMIEAFVRLNAPLTFNMDNGSTRDFDTRSDDRGPEPSALAYGEIGGRHYLFLGAERQNGLFQFDITDLDRVEIVGYFNSVDGVSVTTGTRYVTPEKMVFVSAEKSPTGRPLVIVGYKGIVGAISGSVAVFEIVPKSGGLVNGSFRATVRAGQTLIVGFSVEGAGNVLLRGVGPGLNAAFNVPDVLEDPRLDLFRGYSRIDSNEDWSGSAELIVAASAVGAFPLPPASRDAAILRPMTGAHTVHLSERGPGNPLIRTAGTVLIEAYGVGSGTRFANLSGRGDIGRFGGPLVGGFVVGGNGAKSVLLRAVGAELADFGVSKPLADPRLEVHRGNVRVASNNDWHRTDTGLDAAVSEADFAAAGAFPLRNDGSSAALRLLLVPGAYTVHASTYDGSLGEVLLEIYEIR